MIQRCENPHPHFKDRTCNAKHGGRFKGDVPGLMVFEMVCTRCGGPIEFANAPPSGTDVVDKVPTQV